MIHRYACASPRVLDAGCGTGWTAGVVAAGEPSSLVVATDLSTIEASAVRRDRVLLVESDLEALPFRRCFDVLMLLDVLEHFEDDQSILKSAGALLVEGGVLLATVPAMPSLWSGYDDRCGHARRYTRRSLQRLLGGCGFTPVFVSYFMCLLAPALYLRRRVLAKGRRNGSEPLCEGEFRPGWVVSAVMTTWSALERPLLRHGLRLPWGSSLFAVARVGRS
jgi:SAM-dependent methyltransferase